MKFTVKIEMELEIEVNSEEYISELVKKNPPFINTVGACVHKGCYSVKTQGEPIVLKINKML